MSIVKIERRYRLCDSLDFFKQECWRYDVCSKRSGWIQG